jgi:hypothetical protein
LKRLSFDQGAKPGQIVYGADVDGIVEIWKKEGEHGFRKWWSVSFHGLSWSRRRCRFFRLWAMA